jgi:hypothetical protein
MSEISLRPTTVSRGQARCPACKAQQEWSATCRRCKADLTLLCEAAAGALDLHRRALCALRAGDIDEALRCARRGYAVCPDAPAARLLAVCRLLAGDFAGAWEMGRRARTEP